MNNLNYFKKSQNSIRRFALAIIACMLFSLNSHAQLVNVPVTGFNNDVVANGVGATNTAAAGSMAGMVTQPAIGLDGIGYTFIDATYKWYSGSNLPSCFLPTGGFIQSALTPGLTYQMQSYSAPNSMTIASNTYAGSVWPTSGSVALITPKSFSHVYVLYETALNSPGPTITATVTFTDATTQVFSGNILANWFTPTAVAYTPSISRARNVAPGAVEACNTGPYLFQFTLPISAANAAKLVQSISFNWSAAVPATGAAAGNLDYFHMLGVGGNITCSGMPAPGNTLASSNPACSGVNFTLSTDASYGPGSTFQWQSSPDGTIWTNIASATSATLTRSQTVATYYQCLVTCTAGPNTINSNPLFVTMNGATNCYCTNTAIGPSSFFINNFSTTNGGTNITNNASGYSSTGYGNFLGMVASQIQGSSVNFSLNTTGGNCGVAIWADWNQNGVFEATERVYNSAALVSSATGSILVPLTATTGNTRMRVVSNASLSSPVACPGSITTECEDYTFNVIQIAPCVTPIAQVSSPVLTAVSTSQINGSFTAASPNPSGYMVVRYLTGDPETVPVNGTTYTAGQFLGLGKILQVSTSTSFSDPGLSGGTSYTYYVYSYNNLCGGAPFYLTTGGSIGIISTTACSVISGIVQIGPNAPGAPAGFPTLGGANGALAFIAANGISGQTFLELQTDYTSAYAAANETYPLTIGSNPCINSTKTLTIRPASTVSSLITLTSAHTTLATVLLDGASYINFDGRPGGIGTSKLLSIVNTSFGTGASGNAILLRNESSFNKFTYLDLQASNSGQASNLASFAAGAIPGVIVIGTTSGLNGNDNDTISFCDIHAAGNVSVGIFAYNATTAGTAANNDNCFIDGNNVYDWFHSTQPSAGINISLGNNNWTVTNNRIYQPSLRTYGASPTIRGMWITPNTSTLTTFTAGSGFNISNNFIGGDNATGTGVFNIYSPSSYTFFGIDLSLGLGATSNVQGDTITNMNISGAFGGNSVYGINIERGNVDIGTMAPNIIGSPSAAEAIIFTTSANNGSFIGLRSGSTVATTGNINFSNNKVMGITLNGSATTIATGFNGIAASGGSNITITNNTVSNILLPSASANAPTATAVRGIICNSSATGVVNSIRDNLVSNISTNYSATLANNTLVGIDVKTGTSTISGNTIRNLSTNTQSTGSNGQTAAVIGISYTSTASTPSTTISNNTIHTLKSTHPTVLTAIQTSGIWFGGPASGTHTIEKNFIHSISIASVNNSSSFITGIDLGITSGATITVKNNMIRLGFDETGASIVSPCQVRGIIKGSPHSNIWFNSIFIGGTGVGPNATMPTFCLARTGTATDSWRNNILVNNRSNTPAGNGKHYQIYTNVAATSFTLNNNVYSGVGAGTVFGYSSGDVAAYVPNWFAGDQLSFVGDPKFMNPTGDSSVVNLHIQPLSQTVVEQNGANIAAVTDDIDGQLRISFSPDDIGADAGNHTPLNPCAAGPTGVIAALTNTTSLCGPGSKSISLSGYTSQPGLTFQWKESASGLPGSFVNVTTGTGGTTNIYTTATLTSSMYYLCEIACTFGGTPSPSSSVQVVINPLPVLSVTPATGTFVCSGANVDLSASGAASYGWTCNPGTIPSLTPVTSNLFSTMYDLPTVTSRPTSTLPTNNANPPATGNTPVWTYTVTGTSASGCTAQATVVLNVITPAVVPVQLTYSVSPDPVCAPGTQVTFTANNPGTIGAGTWTYNWYDNTGTALLQTTTTNANTNSFTPPVPVANGNFFYKVKVSNSLCPFSYGIATTNHTVGYTSQNVFTDANCGDNGTLKIYPEGQDSYTSWYSNNFATGLLGSTFDASSQVTFPSGRCVLTTGTQGSPNNNGTFLVKNPAAINTNNLQVDFKLNTSLRTFGANYLGADGLCWSYASDVTPGLIPAGAEGGSGTGIKISFDAVHNGTTQTPGVYLMYNCTTAGQGPTSPGVLAFKGGSYYQALTDAPVSITITQGGLLTLKVNNEIVFDHVPLPAAYLAADKSTWYHAFTARTGQAAQIHAIDDLNIRYNSYEYSITSTNGTNGSWQTSNSFTSLPAGPYPVWVRNPSNPSCFTNTANVVIGTSLPPTNPLTIAAPGYPTTICAGNSTNLTTEVPVPGAVFLWESSANIGGPYLPAAGINNTEIYTTGPLTANMYFRFISTCPSSSPVTSIPVLVTVNIGSIASTNSPQTVNFIGNSATLTAVPGPNTTCVWYANPTGGTALQTGNSFTVTPPTLPSIYYVEPVTTVFTDHYNFGGEVTIGNLVGSMTNTTSSSTRFNTSARIRIDSVKVFLTAIGNLKIALQAAGTSTPELMSYTINITDPNKVNTFINLPVNFTTIGAGSFQLTTSSTNGATCSYYSTYSGSYAAPYMSMGGVMQIVGGSTTPTGGNSTGMYGTAFNWSITTSCPVGFGARVPVIVQADGAYAISVATPSTAFCAGTIETLTASSSFAYGSYTWSPVTNLYTDPGATIPYVAGTNTTTVYVKPTAGGNFNYTVTGTGGGTNAGIASITTIAQPTVTVTSSLSSLCAGGNVQLNAVSGGSVSYDWSTNPTYLSNPSISNPIAQGMQSSETYTVIVTDAVTTCQKAVSVAINVKALPVPQLSGNAAVCENDQLTLSAFDGNSYAWSGPNSYSTSTTGDPINGSSVSIFNMQEINEGNYTVTVTNAAGCTTSETQFYYVNDRPELTLASTTPVSCIGGNNGAFVVGVTGGTAPYTLSESITGESNGDGIFDGLMEGTYEVTITDDAIPSCASVNSLVVTVTTAPNVAPSIVTAAASLTVECNGSGNTTELNNWLANNGGASASDACTASLSWSNNYSALTTSCGSTGTVTVTFTATDDDPNNPLSVSTTATFTIVDTTAPSITAASNSTVQCDGAGNTAAVNAWVANHGGATASDICGGVTWTSNFTSLSDLCGATGNATVTFTATDACGNASSSTATFTIVDTTAPTITAASNSTVECDGAGNTAALNAWIANHGGATASDICSGVNWSSNFTSLSDLCGATGSATVTFTATDACGNASSSSATFTIVDVTAPTIVCPANIVVNNTTNQCGTNVNFTATASDVCSGSATINYSIAPGSFFAIGTTTVTATATDDCGNSSSCNFTVTVNDNQVPVINCPASATIPNDPAVCGAVYNYTVTGSDNCAYNIAMTGGIASGQVFPIGTTVNTFVMTDASGNTSTCSFSVTVNDMQAPYLTAGSTCPSSFTACNPVSWIAPVYTDNCPGVQVTSTHTPGTIFPEGMTTVTYTATDIKGNVTTCSFIVSVLDSSEAATSITSNRDYNNICAGGDITLTVNGGHLGEVTAGVPAQWKWYSGSCGGTLVGTGSSITVAPTTTTTYFVRPVGACNTPACVSMTVTVSTVLPAGSVVYSTLPAFGAPGVTSTLSVNPVPGATFYRWFTNNGHINSVLFDGQLSPHETSLPTTQVSFVLPEQNYQIRVLAGNACGRTSQANTHIRGTVSAPTTMTGPTQVCPGNPVTYSIPVIPPVSGNSPVTYSWSLVPSTAGTISVSANGLTATVNFAVGFGTAQVCANGISSFGLPGTPYCLTVTSSAPVPGAVSGNATPCINNTYTYSIASVPNAASYNWTTTAGTVQSVAPNGLSAVILFQNSAFTNKTVCVTASSTCGTSAPSCITVSSGTPANPGDINGPTSGVCGATGVNYYLATSNANSYQWTGTTGMSISSPSTNNSVNVTFLTGFTSGTVTVTAYYDCGNVVKTLNVSGAPALPVILPAAVCPGTALTYFVANAVSGDQYSWVVTGDILDSACTEMDCSQFYLETGAGGGNYAVTASNDCGIAGPVYSGTCRIAAQPMTMEIYPNPTTGMLIVDFSSQNGGQYQITVTDLSGRVVMVNDLKAVSGRNQHQVDLGFANSGLYMIYLKNANGEIAVQKIVVE